MKYNYYKIADVLTVMITPRMIYNFTFFQNMERARLRLVLRKVTDCNTNHSVTRTLLLLAHFL